MANRFPFFFVDNLLSIGQYPAVALAGNEELSGYEAFHVADGRRSGADYWSTITANNPATLAWSDGRLRAADMLALDRGHNLAGVAVALQYSNDNATWFNAMSATIPTLCTPGQAIDAPLGAYTEEGAWLIRFTLQAAVYWRFTIPALGIGLLPAVVGLSVGKSWYPVPRQEGPWMFNLPTSPGGATLKTAEVESERGWVANGLIGPRKEGDINIKLTSVWDIDPARLNLESLYGDQRCPMWVCYDDSQAERSFMAQRPVDKFGMMREENWYFGRGLVPYREHEVLSP